MTLIDQVKCPRCGEQKFSFDDFCTDCLHQIEDSGLDGIDDLEYDGTVGPHYAPPDIPDDWDKVEYDEET